MSTLYHYTTLDALVGLFSDCTSENNKIVFWASHALFSNDITEKKIWYEIFFDALIEFEKQYENIIEEDFKFSEVYKDNKDFYDINFRTVNIFENYTHTGEGLNYFISLSRNEDTLSMWEMYAKRGTGIAIGFNDKKLKSYVENLHQKNKELRGYLRECIYHKKEESVKHEMLETMKAQYLSYKKLSDKKFEDFGRLYGKADASNIRKFRTLYLLSFFNIDLSTMIKDKSFFYENEVRILIKENRELNFRVSNNLITPYIKYPIDASLIERIIIAPVANFELNKIAVSKMLSYKGVNNEIPIIKSSIPYRI